MLKRLLARLLAKSGPPFEMPPEHRLRSEASGLRYDIVEPGEGDPPSPTSTVTVRYAGWTMDGRLFDQSYPGKATFPLDRVIPGWTEGLQLVRPGGKIKLVIPPLLAYGASGSPPKIGPNQTLLFHVELLSVNS